MSHKISSVVAFIWAIFPAVLSAGPLAQFAYRDVSLQFTRADGNPVAGAAIYGYCRELNLIWPRRDHEVRQRNDIIWQESFLGKTGSDGSVKATLPPGNWRFLAAGTVADGAAVVGWTEPHSPSPGEVIRISPAATRRWSFVSPEQVPLTPRRLLIRPHQFPIWIPVRFGQGTDAGGLIELSGGSVDIRISDDAVAGGHPGYMLAVPTLSIQTPDGPVAAAPGVATIVFKGGKGQSVLSLASPLEPGLEQEIALCDGARVQLSAGNYFLSYRRPIGSGYTAAFVAQLYGLQAGQIGSLDLDSPMSAEMDEHWKLSRQSKVPVFSGQLYMADANGHLLGTLVDVSRQPVRFEATVTIGGNRLHAPSEMQRSRIPQARAADTEPGEDDEEIEENDGKGDLPSPYAPNWRQMLFVVNKGTPSAQPDGVGTWEVSGPPGILPQTTFTPQPKVAVSSLCFRTNVPRIVLRQTTNLLAQADGMIRTMEQVAGHGRSQFNVTALLILPGASGASSSHNGLRTTIVPRVFYSDKPMCAHTIVHETAHNFGYYHGSSMEAAVEVTRSGGTAAFQLSEQPVKWLFQDRMNGLPTRKERKHYRNTGLYLYYCAKLGPGFLRFLSAHEHHVMRTLTKRNYQEDDVVTALLSLATGVDTSQICAQYGLKLDIKKSATVMQQVQELCQKSHASDLRKSSSRRR